MSYKTILQLGRNCWRIRRADRVAFLIDGDAYFTALYHALTQARQEITILSWNIYSELRLGVLQGDKRSLAELLNDQLKSNQQLKAHILNWDFSMLFAMNREWLPSYKLGWQTHPRLSFQLDHQHPIGASHHQKAAILDGQLAFTGGLDLTRGRWDTPDHKANDARRKKMDGALGRPHHDVQIALSGGVAKAMNELAHERWRRATEQTIPKPETQAEPVWPQGLEADLEQVDVAISRTEAAYQDYQEVREIEQLYLDSIEAANDYIYIENRFFTCPGIHAALAKRLQEQHGPEVIINLPLEIDGWLSQNSMDVIRVKLLQELREADRHQRLGVYYPYKHDLKSMPINLHAKVMIVDDRFVRVGSSNINNRSMGLDTECDVAIECAPGNERIKMGLVGFRDQLLAEHLGIEASQFHDMVEDKGSLLNAIESQRQDDKKRTLKPLEDKLPDYTDSVLTESDLIDPEQPVDVENLIYYAPTR